MTTLDRILRHARITWQAYRRRPSPPFLTLFLNSTCNQKCEHCFYWKSLNARDDLSKDEIFALSRSLGRIENLYLSGGEPFLRAEFGEICRHFIRHNRVRQIYVPTNGSFSDRIAQQIAETLKEPDLDLFCAEISLDGLADFHDRFRGMRGAFDRAMATYAALAEMQEKDPRLRIHAVSTATADNLEEIRGLTTYLFEHCPKMDHHNLGMVRGERKNPGLREPGLAEYMKLYDYVKRLWGSREAKRYGAIVEPMLQAAKARIAAERRQVIPCKAGVLSAVVYANGDVSVCETHSPIGNLRRGTFAEIWESAEAVRLRESIARRQCFCTQEIALWTSFTYQPLHLARLMFDARVWRQPEELPAGDRAAFPAPAAGQLVTIRAQDHHR